MATRMQQRRGTAAEWTSANPVLAAGEIGYETDTNQFKIGDGTTAWSSLTYFKDATGLDGDFITDDEKGVANGVATLDPLGQIPVSQLGNIIDAAPEALDTLAEVAAALTDADGIVQTKVDGLEASLTTYIDDNISSVQSQVDSNTSNIGINSNAIVDLGSRITAAESAIGDNMDNIAINAADIATNTADIAANAADIATNASAITTLGNDLSSQITTVAGDLSTHETATTNVHGIADTSLLETQSGAQAKADAAEASADAYTDSAISAHNAETTNVHGIADTSLLATQSYVDTAESDANSFTSTLIGDATVDGTSGNTVTDRIATGVSTAETYADNAVADHNLVTTNVHGIADTSLLVTTDAASQTLDGDLVISGDLTVSGTTITLSTANFTTKDNMVYMNQASLSDITNAVGDGTNVVYTTAENHGYEVGNYVTIYNMDPATFDYDSTGAEITAVTDTTFTIASTVTDTFVSGGVARGKVHTNPDLGWAGGRYDGTYGHTGVFRDASDATFKFFDGYIPEPDDDVFIDTTHASFALAPIAVSTVTTDGIVFSDGTQTKAGVPSITEITEQTASYELSAADERDTIIEMNSSSAVTVTIPTDATVNFPVGTTLDIIQTGTGQVTIAPASGVTINATPGLNLRTQWSACTLLKRGVNLWMAYGDLQA